MAQTCAAVTTEFENVPAKTLETLAESVVVRPSAASVAIAQNRVLEKNFIKNAGLPVAPFAVINSTHDLPEDASSHFPGILKVARFGYDGKGQVVIRPDTALPEAYDQIGGAPAVLEGFVPFASEVSVIAARGIDGSFAAYDVCENEHRNHILWQTRVPATIGPQTQALAIDIARRIGDGLEAVGVFAVEMFLIREGAGERLIVNEIAPRVHNSGHWTIEGAETSQFEQHIRAIAGWPLGSTARTGLSVTMENLIGDEVQAWPALLAEPMDKATLLVHTTKAPRSKPPRPATGAPEVSA